MNAEWLTGRRRRRRRLLLWPVDPPQQAAADDWRDSMQGLLVAVQ